MSTCVSISLHQVWDIEERTIWTVFEGHQGRVVSIDFSPDGKYVISGADEDEMVRVWDTSDRTGKSCRVCEHPLIPSL